MKYFITVVLLFHILVLVFPQSIQQVVPPGSTKTCASVTINLYDLSHGNIILPASPHRFVSTAGSFTAAAYVNGKTIPNGLNRMLAKVGKNGDICESGLGVYGLDNNGQAISTIKTNEIDIMNHYIQFDFGSIISQYNKIALAVGSTQLGEGYQLYGSNKAGTLGTLFYSSEWDPTGTCPESFPFTFGSQFRYVSITALDVGALNGLHPNKFANVIVKSVIFSCGSPSTPTATPTSTSSSVQPTSNAFNAITCPAIAPIINSSTAANFLTDVPGNLAIVEERFDIPCSQSSYINGICQKVLKKQYATDNFNFFGGLYTKFQPRFKAVTYRPKALPVGVSKFPVIMMVHGNFQICGLKVKLSVSDDGFTKSYSWLDIATRAVNVLGANLLGTCNPSIAQWQSLADDMVFPNGSAIPQGIRQLASSVLANIASSQDPLTVDQDPHLGYRYVAEQLAKRGFFVISISCAQGITGGSVKLLSSDPFDGPDTPGPGGIRAWARMGVATLELMQQWNTYGNLNNKTNGGGYTSFNLKGKLDLQNIGLMGHSRGGNAVRYMQAALQTRDGSVIGGSFPCFNTQQGSFSNTNSYPYCSKNADPKTGYVSLNYANLPKVTVKGVFEIGPVDIPYNGNLRNQVAVDWAVIIPMCDQDVSIFSGRCPADRVLNNALHNRTLPIGSTSVIAIKGTSHDVYNTQWQKTDVTVCDRQRPIQSQISGWDQTDPLNPVEFGEPLPRNLATFFMSNFFAAYVLGHSKYSQVLDPSYSITSLVTNPSKLGWTAIREYVVGTKHSKKGISFSLYKDAHATTGALIRPFGGTQFTDSQQESNDMCLSRTSIVQWNACSGPQQFGDISIPNSCISSRTVGGSSLNCKSNYYNIFLNDFPFCKPLVETGTEPETSQQGFDPVVTLLFNSGASIDTTPYTHIAFSVAREMNSLNNPYQTDLGIVGIKSSVNSGGSTENSDTTCAILSSYMTPNGIILKGPDRNFVFGASSANPNYRANTTYSLLDSTGTAYTLPVNPFGEQIESQSYLVDAYYPEMISVHIPLKDLQIDQSAVGIKLVLSTSKFGISGSLMFGPIELINKNF